MAAAHRRVSFLICLVVIAVSLTQQAFTSPRGAARAAPRTARRAVNKNPGPSEHPVKTPEVNFFVGQKIKDCLSEGCAAEEIDELEAKLARDEEQVRVSIKELRKEMEEKHSHEAHDMLAALRNFLGDSEELREQLEVVRGIKDSFADHLAGAMPFGHDGTGGFLNRGVGVVQPRSPTVPLHSSRTSRTALRAAAGEGAEAEASGAPLETPEANFFVNQRIMDCLTEGCAVQEIEALDATLARDEARTEVAIAELRAEMEQKHSHEAARKLALLRNFLSDSRELREQLGLVKSVKRTFEKHLAGAIAFGEGSTAGLLNRGVGVVKPASASAFAGVPPAGRSAPRVARHATTINAADAGPSGRRMETPEVNVFVYEQIMSCLTEGCPVQEIEELQAKLERDEHRIKAEIVLLRAEMEERHAEAAALKRAAETEGNVQEALHAKALMAESKEAADALGMLRNFLGDSQELREQLEHVKGIKQKLFDHLHGGMIFGNGDTAGLLNRGVGIVLPHRV